MSFVKARRAGAVVAAVFLGACGDSLAPTIDHIDATAATAAAEPVVAVMEQPALASFASLGLVSGLPASASAASVTAISSLTKAAAGGRWDGLAPSFARSAARAADVLPPEVRGNMYVYNRQTASYEVSNNPDAGTPANGIRIVLYAWDALAGAPSSPLTRIGHVDLIDESNASQNRLSVVLVRASDNATLMDYDITHSVTSSSESFSIAGSATNGQVPVTFNLTGNASETAATVTFDLAAASVGFEVHVGMNLNAVTEQATVETSLKYDGHTLSFRLTGTPDGIEGEIRFDGMRYATITITVEETSGSVTTTTTFVKANGQPMTAQEVEQIQAVFERALQFDLFWEALLWPVGALAASPA
jgi:hypothetical protein